MTFFFVFYIWWWIEHQIFLVLAQPKYSIQFWNQTKFKKIKDSKFKLEQSHWRWQHAKPWTKKRVEKGENSRLYGPKKILFGTLHLSAWVISNTWLLIGTPQNIHEKWIYNPFWTKILHWLTWSRNLTCFFPGKLVNYKEHLLKYRKLLLKKISIEMHPNFDRTLSTTRLRPSNGHNLLKIWSNRTFEMLFGILIFCRWLKTPHMYKLNKIGASYGLQIFAILTLMGHGRGNTDNDGPNEV
jgi:hypothetical protein